MIQLSGVWAWGVPRGGDWSPLWLSLRSAGLALVLVVPLGIACAHQVRQWQGRRRTIADLLLLSPLVLPPTVLGFLLLQLLGRYGPLGALLHRCGIEVVFSWPATVISAAVVAFPLMYRSALAALEQIDPALPQVARSLGATELRVLRRITLPLALPGLVAGISLSFARALGEFGTTLMLAGNIPGRTQTMPLALFAAVDADRTDLAWFWTCWVLALNGLSLLLMQRLELQNWPHRHPRGRIHGRRHRRSRRRSHSAWHAADLPLPGVSPAPHHQPFRLELDIHRRLGEFDLDLRLASGCRRIAILGASGAGKSQL